MRATKSELRSHFLEKRRSLTEEQAIELDDQIFQHLLNSFDFSTCRNLHTFLPIKARGEIDTFRMIDLIRNRYPALQLIAPRIADDQETLRHFSLDLVSLEVNSWGIPEPLTNPQAEVSETEVEFVLVPLLAFDQTGHRVGYGKGFYDRFLAKCGEAVPKVGLCQFAGVEEIVDTNQADLKLTACVTPDGVLRF